MSRAERDSAEIDAGEGGALAPQAGGEVAGLRGPPITVRCAGRTSVGQVRDHNEDNFVIASLDRVEVQPREELFEDDVGEQGVLFAVCDGMGGAAAGEVASQMAVDILVEAMRRGGAPKNRDSLARRLVGAVEEAGRRIFDAAQRERSRRGMGTTATVAVLVDRVLFFAEVGDSRAYLLRQGELRQLTKDQSLVNQLIEAGHLTEDEAEAFEHSNIILQALGTSETVQVDLTFVELRRGDRLLMCSDGLSGLLHADTLRTALEELRDPMECSAKLVEYAETAGGHDNITVVVADFDGDGLPEPIEGETFGYVQYPLPMSDHDSSAFVLGETVRLGRRSRMPGNGEADDESELSNGASESPLPPAPSARKQNAGTLRWFMAVLILSALAGVVWVHLQGTEGDDTVSFRASPGPAVPSTALSGQPSAAVPVPAEPEAIDVDVRTDVERATLVVDGKPKGALPVEGQRLTLPPGAHRFEAHRDGTQVAASTLTLNKGEAPVQVDLWLPKGTSEAVGVGAAHPAGEAVSVPGNAAGAAAPASVQSAVPAAVRSAPTAAAAGATAARAERAKGSLRAGTNARRSAYRAKPSERSAAGGHGVVEPAAQSTAPLPPNPFDVTAEPARPATRAPTTGPSGRP